MVGRIGDWKRVELCKKAPKKPSEEEFEKLMTIIKEKSLEQPDILYGLSMNTVADEAIQTTLGHYLNIHFSNGKFRMVDAYGNMTVKMHECSTTYLNDEFEKSVSLYLESYLLIVNIRVFIFIYRDI